MHRKVRHIGAPDLVVPFDGDAAQQVRADLVTRKRAEPWEGIMSAWYRRHSVWRSRSGLSTDRPRRAALHRTLDCRSNRGDNSSLQSPRPFLGLWQKVRPQMFHEWRIA